MLDCKYCYSLQYKRYVCRQPDDITFASEISEKTDSDSTVVTVIAGECSGSVIEEEQSLYSVDQDGFFTSMHADSGLAPLPTTSKHVAVYSSSTDADRCGKTRSDMDSFDTESPGGAADASDVVSVTALTMQLSSSSSLALSEADVSRKTAAIERFRHRNCVIAADKSQTSLQSPLSGVKSLAAFPSFCTVTPPTSDEEEETDANQDERCKTCTALSPSATVSTPLPPIDLASDQDDITTNVSHLDYCTLPKGTKVQSAETSDDSRFSTWPCSPVLSDSSSVRSILKSTSRGTKCSQPQKFLKFSPAVSAEQHSGEPLTNSGDILDETKTSSTSSSVSFTLDRRCSVVDTSSENALRSQSDDLTLLSDKTLSEAGSVSGDDALAASSSSDLSGTAAALVISSPVLMQSTYVENRHRRFLCRIVRPDEWYKHNSYASRSQWSSTLPRRLGPPCRTLNKSGKERHRRKADTDGSELEHGHCGVLGDSQSPGITVKQQSDISLPLTMFRSPRRYGFDAYRKEERIETSPLVKNAAERTLVNNDKKATAVKRASSEKSEKDVRTRTVRRETQHASPSKRFVKQSCDTLQLHEFKHEKLQNATIKQAPETISKRGNVPVIDRNRPASHSSADQEIIISDGTIDSSDIELTLAECQTMDNTFDCLVNTDTSASVACDGGDVELSHGKCLQSDLVPLNTSAVYSVSNARDMVHSSDSISSILSAAERSRAAKLAFLGFSVNDDDDQPVTSPAVGDSVCILPQRSDESSVSGSSSGLGSSVSGSPVVSPDDNALTNGDQPSLESKHDQCKVSITKPSQQSMDNSTTMQFTSKRTVSLIERSRQTAV